MLRPVLLIPIGLSLLVSGASVATEVTVTQNGRAFSERHLTIRAGDTVKFVNDDDVMHNVYSVTEGQAFDLGAQGPATTATHTFTTPGKVRVRCAIHPKMKLDVVVQEAATQP